MNPLLTDRNPAGSDRSPPKTLIVSVNFGEPEFEAQTEEFIMLAQGAGAEIVDTIICKRSRPDAKLFVGTGKAQEIALAVQAHEIELVMFNHNLSPAQQRNIEREIKVRVVDRVALILDIFALRAQSHEGKLQVELAQLQHLVTRLTRMWTHLERQRGGIGMRGPGEAQLEMDKRIIADKVRLLKERLEKLQKQRQTQRRSRARGGAFSVSLVGYTNAGKSTVFNGLTAADVYAADQLFATLDTTTRKLFIEGAGSVVMSDTVGFIRELPHMLIAAFRATLEETIHADLLLHVVDAASPQRDEQIAEVDKVLEEIGAADIPRILVFNKIDLTNLEPGVERDERGTISRVFVSATERLGFDALRGAIVEASQAEPVVVSSIDNDDPRFRTQSPSVSPAADARS